MLGIDRVSEDLSKIVHNIQDLITTNDSSNKCTCVSITGVEFSNKEAITQHILDSFQNQGINVACIRIKEHRISSFECLKNKNPAKYYYENEVPFQTLTKIIDTLKQTRSLNGEFEGFKGPFDISNASLVLFEGNLLLRRTISTHFDYNILVNVSLKTARQNALNYYTNEEDLDEQMKIQDDVYLLAHHQFLLIDEPSKAADYNIILDEELLRGDQFLLEETFKSSEEISKSLKWSVEPSNWKLDGELGLVVEPDPITDYWQRTFYGFRNDNAHFLYFETENNFEVTTTVLFDPKYQFDQAGLCIRIDEDNWIKTSLEYEGEDVPSMLSCVVTNLGFSDWSFQYYPTTREMSYKILRNGRDYVIYYLNKDQWNQIRCTHLHHESEIVKVGLYCCSPIESGAKVNFKFLKIKEIVR